MKLKKQTWTSKKPALKLFALVLAISPALANSSYSTVVEEIGKHITLESRQAQFNLNVINFTAEVLQSKLLRVNDDIHKEIKRVPTQRKRLLHDKSGKSKESSKSSKSKASKTTNKSGKSKTTSKTGKGSKTGSSGKSGKRHKTSRSQHVTPIYDIPTTMPTISPYAVIDKSPPSTLAPTTGATPTVGTDKTLSPTFIITRPPQAPPAPPLCSPKEKIECCAEQSINEGVSFAEVCDSLGCSISVCDKKPKKCTPNKQKRCCKNRNKCDRLGCRYSDCSRKM